MPKHRPSPITTPHQLQPKPPPFRATLPEPPLPPLATAAAAIHNSLVPPISLTKTILQDCIDDGVDAVLKHLGLSFTRAEPKLAK